MGVSFLFVFLIEFFKLQFIFPFQFVGEGSPLPPHTKNS